MDREANDQATRDCIRQRVRSVELSYYSSEEARRVSVKEITSPEAFDGLGRPLPGGLYDPALGPVSSGSLCETCSLAYKECPGHCGHIELIAPLLNPTLAPFLFKILRAKCWHCHHFRSSRAHSQWSIRVLRAAELGNPVILSRVLELNNCEASSHDLADVDDGEPLDATKVAQVFHGIDEAWTKKKRAGDHHRGNAWRHHVENFLSACAKQSSCPRCGGRSPTLRSDKELRLFRLLSKTAESRNRELSLSLPTASSSRGREAQPDAVDLTEDIPPAGTVSSKGTKLVLNVEMAAQLDELRKVEPALSSLIWGYTQSREVSPGTDILLLRTLIVPPSRFRPPGMAVDDEEPREHPQNVFLTKILQLNRTLRLESAESRMTSLERVRIMHEAQMAFNSLLSSTEVGGASTGLKQLLEQKEGLFRMNMMGKRVNFSARSVIGPDPFLDSCEIGVPVAFAMKLTIPEPVSYAAEGRLKQAVINGPMVHPGANFIEDGSGRLVRLRPEGKRRRIGQSRMLRTELNGDRKVVFRHLRTGDIVLFNRQPSLHRPSIMAHRVRILPGESTLRMHYANCGAYNADFDGDEMNMHVPQDGASQAEAWQLVLADRQYITATSGGPIRGLIQDHVVAGVLLTKRDTFLSFEDVQQLLYSSVGHLVPHSGCFSLPAPCILKPRALWSGKQLISMLLSILGPNGAVSLASKTRTKDQMVGPGESSVLVRNSQLLHGILDKSQLGASSRGLIHAFYEIHGSEATGNLLSTLGRLLTLFLRIHGHTTGVDDLLLDPDTERTRIKAQKDIRRFAGRRVIQRMIHPDLPLDPVASVQDCRRMMTQLLRRSFQIGEAHLDKEMKTEIGRESTALVEACLPVGLVKKFPSNGFLLMTSTGAKGSKVNSAQISCQLGQTELEGRRVPRSASGSTLPLFAPFDSSARAGGYISGRFLSGIRPQEYYLHCMAGREGLVDTAVKTARSGYLQRCLVKHMEGISLAYDWTVRNGNGAIIQFCYGEDGLDPSKTAWLTESFDWAAMNIEAFPREDEGQKYSEREPNEEPFDAKVRAFAENRLPPSQREEFQAAMRLRYRRGLMEPGDAVGVLAAQSVGEPSTQMTLNTFHFAGMGAAHVTLGIPRLRELLMTASRRPETPSMTLPVSMETTRAEAEDLARKMSKVCLGDILEGVSLRDEGHSADGLHRQIRIRVHFPSEKLYGSGLGLTWGDVSGVGAKNLKVKVQQMLAIEVRGIAGRLGSNVLDPTASTANFHEEGDDCGPKTKKAKLVSDETDSGASDSESASDSAPMSEAEANGQSDDESPPGEPTVEPTPPSDAQSKLSMDNVLDDGPQGSIDPDSRYVEWAVRLPSRGVGRIMVADLVREAARESVIRELPGITRCFLEPDGDLRLSTEGSNLTAMWEYSDCFDLPRAQTNDVYEMSTVYGIEASQATLQNQLLLVFQAYGIPVDRRHLGLIAAYSTMSGEYRGFNRGAMDQCESNFQQASFETSLSFLTRGALANNMEDLSSPSSRICVGKLVSFGTGSFDLLQRLQV